MKKLAVAALVTGLLWGLNAVGRAVEEFSPGPA